jgi:hypothetical protein
MQTQLKTAETAAQSGSRIHASQVRAAAIRTMSEELKNTLGIIKGYVSSVIGTGQGGINEKQQEFLGMVINRSARLEKFINDLVDIYQVEIEQKDAKTEDVNMASEIEAIAFNFQTQTELKNLKFKVEAKPGLPKVPVVRRRLTQLWNVLYLQLIKDTPKGSTVPITLELAGDKVKVTVQDPGLIVLPASLPNLFDEFYDPKHPASAQLAGTGLKLALVKTILTAHGGNAVAEKADVGTKLILTFATKVKPAGIPVSAVKPEIKSDAPAITAPHSSASGTALPKPLPTSGINPDHVSAAKPSSGSSIPGLTVGARPPAGDGAVAGSALPPLPPIPGLTVGAISPFSASTSPKPSVPSSSQSVSGTTPTAVPASGILEALISGKIPSVTAPGLKPTVTSTPPPSLKPLTPPVPPSSGPTIPEMPLSSAFPPLPVKPATVPASLPISGAPETPSSIPAPPLAPKPVSAAPLSPMPVAPATPPPPAAKPFTPISPVSMAGMPGTPISDLSASLEDLIKLKTQPPKSSSEDDLLE